MTDHPTPSGKLIVSHDGPVTTLTLNRPEVHNALDREVSAELNAAIKQIDVDRDCRVLVLRGAGETFCAGDDIKEFNTWSHDDVFWQGPPVPGDGEPHRQPGSSHPSRP